MDDYAGPMTRRNPPFDKNMTPWGREPLTEIPVPPFASRDEGEKYFKMLAIYVALLDGPVSGVRPSTYAVTTLLETSRAALREVKEWPAPLDPDVLLLSLTVFFPVPWTPHGLAAAISAAPWDRYRDWRVGPDSISWCSDPRFVAERRDDGSWVVTEYERGNESSFATPRDDNEMVLLLTGRQRTPAYPFAWSTDPLWIRDLDEAAAPFRKSWARHSELPYLAGWNPPR
jgi:hypothetical protein